ncbi:MAG TPA: lysophospholipid acyltransferase family protein, partial [Vicinamibacterales bacterium]|nr:lysophospholipid acyltransferase family protein [Vicinamibacterales bacterium]
ILPAVLYFRDRGIVAVTSENFDGEWIARLMRRFGYAAARGSTSRGGSRALIQLRRDMAAGRPAAFTVDGPRGPARRAQAGAVWLAKATGNPVVPFHIEAARGWELPSWDRGLIPRPWSRVAIVLGAPLEVPGDADPGGIEAARAELERRLAALEDEALALLAG